MKFNEKLIALRKEKALTQEELAEMLGVTRQAVSRWETGETTPEMSLLAKLCKIYGVSADYLINDEVNIKPEEQQQKPETVSNKNRKEIVNPYLPAGLLALASVLFLISGIIFVSDDNIGGFFMLLASALDALASVLFFVKASRKK